MIHKFKPEAITIAEEMSGMPGLAADTEKRDSDSISGSLWGFLISG